MTSNKKILLTFYWKDDRIYKGILRYVKEHNWHLRPFQFMESVIPSGWQADGAIVGGMNLIDPGATFPDIPTIDITCHALPRQIPRVTVDNDAIGTLAAQHFKGCGFRHFAFFSWPQIAVNVLRQKAFFQALLAEGVPQENLHIIHQPPDSLLGSWEEYQRYVHDQLKKMPRPLAVFAGQDNLAATLVELCLQNGIQVPDEISVLGADNIDVICEGMASTLSSVDTNLEALGYAAANQLDRLMNHEISIDEPPRLIPPLGVVVRQSSDVLAVSHPKVSEAVRYIRQHCHEPISLEDIRHHVEMSPRGLESAFLKYLGVSPAVELRRSRLALAKKLLVETDEKVSVIACRCGYSNSSNFGAAFERENGLKPRVYRVRHSGAQLNG